MRPARMRATAPIAVVLVAVSALAAPGKGPAGREAELRKTLASGLVELAAWCGAKKLTAEGRPLVDEALALDPDNAQAKDLKGKLTGDSAAADGDVKEFATRQATYGRKLAGLYRELSTQKHPKAEDARFDGYLVRAAELDPKALVPVADAQAREAQQKGDAERAYRLLTALERIKSEPARAKLLHEVELKAAEKSPILKKASTHALVYYLVLPKGWTPTKKWPILVYVEGAGCNFLGAIKGYAEARGELPFILVTPQTFSSTNELKKDKYEYEQALLDQYQSGNRLPFDEEGLLAVLADVQRDYAGDARIFISGFSGGGNLCWRMVFGHPDLLAAAAPACPNFATAGTVSTAPERETLPIKVFQGDKDEYLKGVNGGPGLENQWLGARQALDANGFKGCTRVLLPGVGHSSCIKEVLDFFARHLKK